MSELLLNSSTTKNSQELTQEGITQPSDINFSVYNLQLGEKKLTLKAPTPEAAIIKFIDYFDLSYTPEKMEFTGIENPFLSNPFNERPSCEIVSILSDAADCEIVGGDDF